MSKLKDPSIFEKLFSRLDRKVFLASILFNVVHLTLSIDSGYVKRYFQVIVITVVVQIKIIAVQIYGLTSRQSLISEIIRAFFTLS